MSILAIVPVKPFSEGKSRLRTCYSLEELYRINRNSLSRTLKTLQSCPEIEQIWVVCRDETVLDLAKTEGVEGLLEHEPYSLNHGLAQALAHVNGRQTQRILIIPTDLPRLQTEDIECLIADGQNQASITLVPDHNQTGTNAVLLNSVKGFVPQFGRYSFQKHTNQALSLTRNVTIKLIENIQHDLDTSTDLDMLDAIVLDELKLRTGKDY